MSRRTTNQRERSGLDTTIKEALKAIKQPGSMSPRLSISPRRRTDSPNSLIHSKDFSKGKVSKKSFNSSKDLKLGVSQKQKQPVEDNSDLNEFLETERLVKDEVLEVHVNLKNSRNSQTNTSENSKLPGKGMFSQNLGILKFAEKTVEKQPPKKTTPDKNNSSKNSKKPNLKIDIQSLESKGKNPDYSKKKLYSRPQTSRANEKPKLTGAKIPQGLFSRGTKGYQRSSVPNTPSTLSRKNSNSKAISGSQQDSQNSPFKVSVKLVEKNQKAQETAKKESFAGPKEEPSLEQIKSVFSEFVKRSQNLRVEETKPVKSLLREHKELLIKTKQSSFSKKFILKILFRAWKKEAKNQ